MTQREIKFRAWDISKNQWMKIREEFTVTQYLRLITFDGEILEAIDATTDCGKFHLDDEDIQSGFILEQFTGLKDKNGNDIYEGDVYKDEHGTWVVVFYPPGFTLMCSCHYPDGDFLGFPHPDHIGEIIGNIHENPELLQDD